MIKSKWILTVCVCVGFCINPPGTFANSVFSKNAFSKPSVNLDNESRLDFFLGESFFSRMWVIAPSSTQASDGLGPLYNARSCMSCHPNNGRALAPFKHADDASMLVARVSIPVQSNNLKLQRIADRVSYVPEPTYGMQMQYFAIPGHKAESRLQVYYKESRITLGDGSVVRLRKPQYDFMQLNYGALHSQVRISPRVAPQLIGLGLLAAIDEQEILSRHDPDDHNADGISGRVNRVWSQDTKKVQVGRFGYKASVSSINEQTQSAFSRDLGLSVPYFSDAYGDCTSRQTECIAAPNGNSPQYENLEVHQQVVDLVNTYVSNIDVPEQRRVSKDSVLAGKKLFEQIGCNACHTPSYQLTATTSSEEGRFQSISPYTDLLLHDMGEGLADHFPEGEASGREWRTAPLWGIGLTKYVSGQAQFLHDGRARSLIEAILWHGGEAQTHRDKVISLDRASREQLLTFIESL